MNLANSASRQAAGSRDRGYAMAALLIAMAVMAILMTVALPTWKQTIQREKEEELIFRGNQYARAIGAYQRKYANASPQTFDVLVDQHFLRKKFTDPFSLAEDGAFQPITASVQSPGAAGTLATPTASRGGGIIGVTSTNTGTSIREYNGHTHYNEWQFVPVQQTVSAGGSGGGAGQQRTQGGGSQGQSGQGAKPGTQTQTPGGSNGNIQGNGPQGGTGTVTPQGSGSSQTQPR
jgi:type II secretory pathway pseudopilin PulG